MGQEKGSGDSTRNGSHVVSAVAAYAPVTPAWHGAHRVWLSLMENFIADCDAAGVDDLPLVELNWQKSYVAGYLHDLVRARCAEERSRIVAEAQAFLEQQQRQAATNFTRRR